MLSQSKVNRFKEKYEEIYYLNIVGYEFIFRPLKRREFDFLNNIDEEQMSEEEKDEMLCSYCIVYPGEIDIDSIPAGTITTLAQNILAISGFYPENAQVQLAMYRAEMHDIESQMESVISMAFPTITLETIENWPTSKVLKYYSRAEWILHNLQNIPVGQILEDLNSEGLVEGSEEDFPEIFG